MSDFHLTLYSRLGCHLCEDMENLLPSYIEEAGLSLNIIYIDKNDELERQMAVWYRC